MPRVGGDGVEGGTHSTVSVSNLGRGVSVLPAGCVSEVHRGSLLIVFAFFKSKTRIHH